MSFLNQLINEESDQAKLNTFNAIKAEFGHWEGCTDEMIAQASLNTYDYEQARLAVEMVIDHKDYELIEDAIEEICPEYQ